MFQIAVFPDYATRLACLHLVALFSLLQIIMEILNDKVLYLSTFCSSLTTEFKQETRLAAVVTVQHS
jgi:hypothetical protein